MKKIILFFLGILVLINLYYLIENNIYVKSKDLFGVYIPTTQECFKCKEMRFEINSTNIKIICDKKVSYNIKYERRWNNLYYDTNLENEDFFVLPQKINVTYDLYDKNVDIYYWRGDEDFCIAEKIKMSSK